MIDHGPLDLDALAAECERDDGTDCVVTRSWLRRALKELREARNSKANIAIHVDTAPVHGAVPVNFFPIYPPDRWAARS